jgi:hypothetical protein
MTKSTFPTGGPLAEPAPKPPAPEAKQPPAAAPVQPDPGSQLAQAQAQIAELQASIAALQAANKKLREQLAGQQPADGPKPAAPESDTVRFITFDPTWTQARLQAQQQIAELLAQGWHTEGIAAPGVHVVVMLVNTTLPVDGLQQTATEAVIISAARSDPAAGDNHKETAALIPERGAVSIIFAGETMSDGQTAYAQALAAGASADDLAAAANRDLAQVAQNALRQARSDSEGYMPKILDQLGAWRKPHAAE